MLRVLTKKCFSSLTKTCRKYLLNSYYSLNYENRTNIFFELWSGRKFIGTMYGEDYFDGGIYIDHISIREGLRKNGYGTYLIESLKGKYKYVYVESTNEAFGFYRKLKFVKKRNQNNRIYGDTIDMYIKFKKEKLI